MLNRASIRGAYMIETLIVVAILLIVVTWQLNSATSTAPNGKKAFSEIEKAKNADCLNNMNVIKSQLVSVATNETTQEVTIETLKNMGYPLPVCRDGGVYSIVGTQVYCSLHSPQATPTPTPNAVNFFDGRSPQEVIDQNNAATASTPATAASAAAAPAIAATPAAAKPTIATPSR